MGSPCEPRSAKPSPKLERDESGAAGTIADV
jgi:hypothetical protein